MVPHVHKHSYLIGGIQIIFLILFVVFVRYGPEADARFHPVSNNATIKEVKDGHLDLGDGKSHANMYPMFQDVHVMIFVGFGFLMTFLKRYGFSAVGMNFLIASLTVQWAILVNGFFHLHDGMILIDLPWMLSAEFVAATILISFGAVIGTTTPTQLIIMAMIEVPIFAINEVIGRRYFGAIDMGDSMFVHMFGAYFGLAVSLMLYRKDVATSKEGSSYQSDIFAMIGTLFLWLYWPSFNGGAAVGDDQHRAIINTYIALAACCLTAYFVSSVVDEHKKFDMVHIQNSTLAGGVAVGTAADLMVQPWGAVLIGMVAGTISVLGYTYLTPVLCSKLRIHDTCGVHNLHGMPAVLAGIIGAIMAALASEEGYGASLYQIFPARSPADGSDELTRVQRLMPEIQPGYGISGNSQALYQFLALIVTLAFAIVGGLITGGILRIKIFRNLEAEELYEDQKYWKLEDGEEEHTVGSFTSVEAGVPMHRVVHSDNDTK